MSRWVNPTISMGNIGLNHLDNGRPNKLKCLGFGKLGENTNHFFFFPSHSCDFSSCLILVLVFDSSSSSPRLRFFFFVFDYSSSSSFCFDSLSVLLHQLLISSSLKVWFRDLCCGVLLLSTDSYHLLILCYGLCVRWISDLCS